MWVFFIFLFGVGRATAQDVSYTQYGNLLDRFVSDSGLVDYAGLKKQPHVLNQVVAQFAETGPSQTPDLFKTSDDSLAFWINAYNVLVIDGVTRAFPIASVTEVAPEPGFFKIKHRVDGRALSLDEIEHGIVRPQFGDPRIHAAVNCAAISCPKLQTDPFLPDSLDRQLDRSMRSMVQNPRHVRVDRTNNTLYLSQIFNWFEGDFISWYRQAYPVDDPSVVDYIALFASPDDRAYLSENPDLEIEYLSYDWTLNSQKKKEYEKNGRD